MKNSIDLPEKYYSMTLSILSEHQALLEGTRVFIFGSRATGSAKEYSDIDILVEGSAPLSTLSLAQLRHAFQESDLPFSVDIVDASAITPEFYELIRTDAIQIWPELKSKTN